MILRMLKASVLSLDHAPRFVAISVASVAIWFGLVRAILRAWLCDDAFISFRYAQNFVHGLGLVFNAGERVEGYTNFLWTVWISLGLLLSFGPEKWSVFWGIVFYLGTILLLLRYHFVVRNDLKPVGFVLPLAALLASLHPDWNIFASSGLETSLFTFLLFAGFFLLVREGNSLKNILLASSLFSLAYLTRPEGALFGVIGAAFVLWTKRPRLRAFIAYCLVFGAISLTHLYWRLYYYGDIFPNTYYAKSADLAWYAQGLYYVRLYFERYWILVFSLGVIFLFFDRRRTEHQFSTLFQPSVLAFVFSTSYLLYIIRVGGDFMFARMLIPITPFLLVLVENLLFLVPRFKFQAALSVFSVICMIHTTAFFAGPIGSKGVMNEWYFYHNVGWDTQSRIKASIISQYFEGLPLKIGFFGSQARFVYYVNPAVAIECDAGLTDYFTARLPITKRGRVGHEKKAPLAYLIEAKKVNLILDERTPFRWNKQIPYVPIQIESIHGRLLHWDATLLGALKKRGAEFNDFPLELDRYIEGLESVPEQKVLRDYVRFKNFYFDFNHDPARENSIRARLSLPPTH